MDAIAGLNLDELEPNQLNAAVAMGIAIGTLYCFLGYRTLKFVIGLTGFLLAAGSAAVLAGWLSQGHLLSMAIAALLGGLCGALALFFLYKTGIFVLGLLASALIAHQAFETRPESWIPLAVLGIGLAGGAIALLVERPVVIVATSAIGAWIVIAGMVFFLFNPDGMMEGEGARAIDEYQLQIAAAWAALALFGILAQWVTRPKAAKES